MTQIAATIGSIGGKAAHGAKASAAKSAGGTDFASLVSAAGVPGDDDDAAEDSGTATLASGDAPDKDTGTGDGKNAGDGKSGDGIVLDLALNAAAQSAMADTVVAAQPPVAAPAPAPTKANGKTAEKGEGIAALDGKLAGRPASWQAMKAAAAQSATGKSAPSATTTGKAKADDVITAAATTTATTTDTAPLQAAIGQALAQADAKPVAPKAARDKAQAGTPVWAAADASTAQQPAAEQSDAKEQTTAPATSALPPIFAALPQAVIDPKQAQAAAQATATATAVTTDPAVTAAIQMAAGEAPVSPAIATTARPVMSALHRALPATTQANATATQTAQAVPAASTNKGKDGSAKDQGKGTGTATSLSSDSSSTTTADASASTAPFSDILQNLPPLAQSRIGLVANAGPVSGADVGATLQGQAIDMGVGGQWIDRMAKEITALSDGTGHSRFQLSPPNLGRIQVEVAHGENGGQVQILTETDEAARRLRDGKADLQADARLSALSITSISIEKAGQSGFDGNSGQNAQQSPQRHASADQGFGQGSTQTGSQDGGQGNRGAQQSAMQAGSQGQSQAGSNGQQNSTNQGKDPWGRAVLKDSAGTTAQDGSSVRRDGDRLVRYA